MVPNKVVGSMEYGQGMVLDAPSIGKRMGLACLKMRLPVGRSINHSTESGKK